MQFLALQPSFTELTVFDEEGSGIVSFSKKLSQVTQIVSSQKPSSAHPSSKVVAFLELRTNPGSIFFISALVLIPALAASVRSWNFETVA